ncbi:MAG: response regulator transcription factor, partial [Desulfuromonadaceae bacterium]|nr:response regulator transcription factor [Desulfuromonadaceae bacterium]
MSLNILVVDDHAIFREGLKSLLNKEPDMTVVGEAGNGSEAVRFALELRPDVVIMDISMPSMNGIEATRRIVAELPDTKVLVLSVAADRRFI